MAQLEHIEAIEKRLWSAADTLVALPDSTDRAKAIIEWLYRGETGRYLDLVASYCRRMLAKGSACVRARRAVPVSDFIGALATLRGAVEPFLKTLAKDAPHGVGAIHESPLQELDDAIPLYKADVEAKRVLEERK